MSLSGKSRVGSRVDQACWSKNDWRGEKKDDLGLFGGEEVRLGQGFPFPCAGASMVWTSHSCRKRLSWPIQPFLTCLVVGQKGQR